MPEIIVYDKSGGTSPWETISSTLKTSYRAFSNKKELFDYIKNNHPAVVLISCDGERHFKDLVDSLDMLLRIYGNHKTECFFLSSKEKSIDPLKQKHFKKIHYSENSIIALIQPVLQTRLIDDSISKHNGLFIGGNVIIGKSKTMRNLFSYILENKSSDNNCLVEGETGTGKELIARALHYYHPRRTGNEFRKVDIGHISSSLFESEMFGVKKGAFSGAYADREGIFENNEGTLFMDEIENLPVEQQAKILTVIQDRKFRKVGSTKYESINARLVFGTNKSLMSDNTIQTEPDSNKRKEHAVQFREDLFHRIATFHIKVPPLRERIEDIPLLVEHFILQKNKETGRTRSISSQLKKILAFYPWSGNVRELNNALQQILTSTKVEDIDVRNLNPEFLKHSRWYSIPFDPALNFDNPQRIPNSLGQIPINILLKEARKQRGLTQKQGSLVFNTTQSNFSYWEKGHSIDRKGKTRSIPQEQIQNIEKWVRNCNNAKICEKLTGVLKVCDYSGSCQEISKIENRVVEGISRNPETEN